MNIKYIEIPSICPICGADTEIIKEYESGNGKFDNNIVQKIKKTLNI